MNVVNISTGGVATLSHRLITDVLPGRQSRRDLAIFQAKNPSVPCQGAYGYAAMVFMGRLGRSPGSGRRQLTQAFGQLLFRSKDLVDQR